MTCVEFRRLANQIVEKESLSERLESFHTICNVKQLNETDSFRLAYMVGELCELMK